MTFALFGKRRPLNPEERYPFRNEDHSPAYITRGPGDPMFFFSPQKRHRSERADLFKGHHLIPSALFDSPDFCVFWKEIESRGYRQENPRWNQAWLPTQNEDVLRLGAAKYSEDHSSYDDFVESKLLEIKGHAEWFAIREAERLRSARSNLSEAAAVKEGHRLAYDRAFNDVRGLQQWIKWALQATDKSSRTPILVVAEDDIRLGGGKRRSFPKPPPSDMAHVVRISHKLLHQPWFDYSEEDQKRFWSMLSEAERSCGEQLTSGLNSGIRVNASLAPRGARQASDHVKLQDVVPTRFGWAVSRRIVKLIQSIDHGTHQFLPFEICRKDGSPAPEPRWLFNNCARLDTAIAEEHCSGVTRISPEKPNWIFAFTPGPRPQLAVHKTLVANRAIWTDKRWKRTFVSARFWTELQKLGIEEIESAFAVNEV